MRLELDVIDPAVSCEGCGACCLHVGTPPAAWPAYASPRWGGKFLTDSPDYALWLSMPDAVRAELRAYYRAALEEKSAPDRSGLGVSCLWYDAVTRRCRHHEHRPAACREFAVGGDDCLRIRKEQGVAP